MTEQEIKKIVEKQRDFFLTGATLEVAFRIQALKNLKSCILKYESVIHAALKQDLGKSNFEGYMCKGCMDGFFFREGTDMLLHIADFT